MSILPDDLRYKIRTFEPCIINGYTYNSRIPEGYESEYFRAISNLKSFYDPVAAIFHTAYPEPPYTVSDFLRFMRDCMGFTVTVIPLNHGFSSEFAGIWQWADKKTKKDVFVFINGTHPPKKQKITIFHECFHVLQDLDDNFKKELLLYPFPIRSIIGDRVAELAAIEVSRPKSLYELDRMSGLTTEKIAEKYDVSFQVAQYS